MKKLNDVVSEIKDEAKKFKDKHQKEIDDLSDLAKGTVEGAKKFKEEHKEDFSAIGNAAKNIGKDLFSKVKDKIAGDKKEDKKENDEK
ncbi:MAG: hypothetical protein LBQ37_00540 [Elusimicrobiota bacterium]|jgi:hypothetical protein|nr:hypothetical protein [Elusimicrobiota bacterium]